MSIRKTNFGKASMKTSKSEIQLNTIRQVEELVLGRIDKIGPVMDDYDGGQKGAYEDVLNDLKAFRAIIKHTGSF